MNQYGSDEFDDPELSRSLGRMSGAFPDAGAALGQVQARVKRVRQRRAAVWSSGALVAVVAVGAIAVNGPRSAGTLRPATSADLVTSSLPDSSSSTSVAVSVPASTATTVVTTTIDVSTTPVSVDDSVIEGEDDNSAVTPSSGAVTPTTAKAAPRPPVSTTPGSSPSSSPGSSSPGSSSPGSTNPGSSTTEPDDDDGDDDGDDGGSFVPATQTFSGIGGSMTVSMDSEGRLRMLSYSANAGYTADDIRNGEQQVGIRFRNGDLTTRIRVEVSGGTMVPQILEED